MRRTWAEKRREARMIAEDDDIDELVRKYEEYLRLRDDVLKRLEILEERMRYLDKKIKELP